MLSWKISKNYATTLQPATLASFDSWPKYNIKQTGRGKMECESNAVQPQRVFKGCCCKRSQCIKNYCDCYQSMIVCTKFCKCIGCRNTEHRVPTKPMLASKKERNSMTSAAATYRKPLGIAGSVIGAAGVTTIINEPYMELASAQFQAESATSTQHSAAAATAVSAATLNATCSNMATGYGSIEQQLAQLQAQRSNFVGGNGAGTGATTQNSATAQTLLPPQQAPKVYTLFTAKLNDAIMNSHIQQVEDAALNGLNEADQCVLTMHEFTRNLTRAYRAAFIDN